MICVECEDIGVVPYVPLDNPKPDAAIGAEDLRYALCLCPRGLEIRARSNGAGKPSLFGLWHLWAAAHGIDPARVCLLEDAFEPADLARAGFLERRQQPVAESIADAMRTRRAKL